MNLKNYLIKNNLDRSQKGCYDKIARKYGMTEEAVRSAYRRLRSKGLVEPENYNPAIIRKKLSQKDNIVKKPWHEEVNGDWIVEPEDSDCPIPAVHEAQDEVILYFADQHFMHHDKDVIKLIIGEAKNREVSTIVLGGDLLDFYQVSRFSKRPDKSKLVDELEASRRFFEGLRSNFPDATIYSLTGNHEARLLNYVINSAPALFGLAEISLPNLLRTGDFGISQLQDKQILKVGHLNIMHGHEVKLFPMGINVAKSMLDRVGKSCIFGHFHRTNQWIHTDIDGESIGAWSVGATSDLHPDYNTYGQNWNHGYALINMKSDGTFSVENKIIDQNLNIY